MTRKLTGIPLDLSGVVFQETDELRQDLFVDVPVVGRKGLRDTPNGREWLHAHRFTSRRESKWNKGEFIAWDGEGVTSDNGDHHYIMLVNSLGENIKDRKGLHTIRCFNRLLDTAKANPNAVHVIFAGGYDANMMLRSIPKRTLQRIYSTESGFWQQYSITYRPQKFLRIYDRKRKVGVTLWDVFTFFQCSFVKAVEQYLGEVPELENIRLHKAQRSTFTLEAFDEILAYCQDELTVLVQLVRKLRENLIRAGITLSRWDGPGAVAASLFQQNKIKEHKLAMEGELLERVNRAAQYAYAGGRIEAIRFGDYSGPTYCYDLNSAYPAAISQLPSLCGSTWRHTQNARDMENPHPFSLYHLRILATERNQRAAYPLFFRTERGMIYFPLPCEGWYWTPEYEIVRDFDFDHQVLEAYIFQPGSEARPFAFVSELYDERRRLKAKGDGAEKAIKLGLNSLYGKMIQQKGYNEQRGLPPYHQLEWGGYVTSSTRAALYRAAYPVLDAGLIGFETDGIFTTIPLNVELSESLGGWSLKRYEGITYVQSGVYWILDNGTWKGKHRGFDPGTLSRDRVLEAWQGGKSKLQGELTRFRTLGTSLVTDERFQDWCKWITEPRELSLYPSTKREHYSQRKCCYKRGRVYDRFPYGKLHDTAVFGWFGGMSSPYPLRWKDSDTTSQAIWQALAEQANEETEYSEW